MQFAHLKLSHDGWYAQTTSALLGSNKNALQVHYVHIRPAAMQSPCGSANLRDRRGIAKRAWLLCSSKCAVTTALHSHSTFQRPIGVRKRRSTLTPRLPPSPCVIPLWYRPYTQKQNSLCFLSLCLTLIDQGRAVTTASATLRGRGYNRASATLLLYVAQCMCIHFRDLIRSPCDMPRPKSLR